MNQVSIIIDGVSVSLDAGATLLDAADAAGIYVPRLCAHPSLGTRGHCGICAVEVDGSGIVRACETPAREGGRVSTGTAGVQRARAEALNRFLAIHPHVCLTCDLRDGCSRSQCSFNLQIDERCCEKFGSCEFQKVACFVGIRADAPTYVPRGLPKADEGLYGRNLNLCIGCLRCRDACRDLAEADAVGEVAFGELALVGPAHGTTMEDAGCVYCAACVHVCPTGALMAKKDQTAKSWLEQTQSELGLAMAPAPPRPTLSLNAATVAQVPSTEGVYQLLDVSGAVLKIRGVINLKDGLLEELQAGKADSFTYEEDPLYTLRETQLIRQYLSQHGKMPWGDELDALF